MKRVALLRHLRRNGCELVREGGQHSWWRNDRTNRSTGIPRHREIGQNLARKICRDLGVEPPRHS